MYNRVLYRPKYHTRVIDLFGQSNIVAYYPLWERDGSVAYDIVNGLNGAYVGLSLGTHKSPSGHPCPSWSGSDGEYVNVYSAGFQSAFNEDEGAILGWIKVTASGTWSDADWQRLFFFYTDNQNYIDLAITNVADSFRYFYVANNTFDGMTPTLHATAWIPVCIAWSASNDRVRLYLNGELFGTSTGLGAFQGSIGVALIGCWLGGSYAWEGNISDVLILNTEPSAAQVKSFASFAKDNKVYNMSILGDSIATAVTENWPWVTSKDFQDGACARINHAAGSATVMSNMDGQVVAAASDEADIIIIALGTNDNNAGDMGALQTEIEENIAELKASNPRATIYYMNVLPRWTDVGGGTPIDKSNIRAAVAAACNAQSITCWDTFTSPWIASSDTSDGTHPDAGGSAKIAAQVLARLP